MPGRLSRRDPRLQVVNQHRVVVGGVERGAARAQPHELRARPQRDEQRALPDLGHRAQVRAQPAHRARGLEREVGALAGRRAGDPWTRRGRVVEQQPQPERGQQRRLAVPGRRTDQGAAVAQRPRLRRSPAPLAQLAKLEQPPQQVALPRQQPQRPPPQGAARVDAVRLDPRDRAAAQRVAARRRRRAGRGGGLRTTPAPRPLRGVAARPAVRAQPPPAVRGEVRRRPAPSAAAADARLTQVRRHAAAAAAPATAGRERPRGPAARACAPARAPHRRPRCRAGSARAASCRSAPSRARSRA